MRRGRAARPVAAVGPRVCVSYSGLTLQTPVGESVSTAMRAAAMPGRVEDRLRALASEALFGATEGLRYVINPSPEGMHALRSRMVLERFDRAPPVVRARYLRVAVNLPDAFFPMRLEVAQPILDAADMARLRSIAAHTGAKFKSYEIDITYPLAWGAEGVEAKLASMCAESVDAIRSGHNILIISARRPTMS